jgi:hypothetical protein
LWFAACALLASGCARVYDVKVDALRNPEVQPGHSYRITVKDHGRQTEEREQQRAAALVRQALAGHGMFEAENPDDAEVAVEVDYEVGPQRRVTETDPVADQYVLYDRYGGRIPAHPVITSEVRVRTVYEKKLTIVARENGSSTDGKERPPRELWRVEVRVDDGNDSVDEVLPVLVGAAVDHIGTDSAQAQNKRISDDSEPVNFVKGGS